MGQLLLAGARSGPRDFPRLHVKPDGRRGPLTGCSTQKRLVARLEGLLCESDRPPLCPRLALAAYATRRLRDETGHSQNSAARTPHPAQVVQGWCAD